MTTPFGKTPQPASDHSKATKSNSTAQKKDLESESEEEMDKQNRSTIKPQKEEISPETK